jgi:YfiH family protein
VNAPQDWIIPEWDAPARVRSIVTTRNGGVSRGAYATFNVGLRAGDDEAAVIANRRLLRAVLPAEPKWLRQVHAARVVAADDVTDNPEADASVARAPGIVCAVTVADCLPVLVCDRAGTVVAAAHAGWRGLLAGVLESTVAAMQAPPHDLVAYLGPAIGPDAFEVGADVRDAFVAHEPADAAAFGVQREGKWLGDLFALARERLRRCGVEHVTGGGLCTYGNPARFYSYRRDKSTGRMAALIWIEPSAGEA